MKKNLFLTFTFLTGAMLVSCGETEPKTPAVPEKATIEGATENTLPEESVLLTASAEGAESYAWYKGTTKIEGETSDTYLVTESGTYFVAGVNKGGEGSRSDAKEVTITIVQLPGTAVITGASQNTLPELTLTLTASAEGAQSYVWYKGSSKIDGEVSNTYIVTESGAYYAAGVNQFGEGAISSAKQVTIYGEEYIFNRTDLVGTYSVNSVGLNINANSFPNWTSEVRYDEGNPDLDVYPFFSLSNWGNLAVVTNNDIEAVVFLDIDNNNRMTVDQNTPLGSTQGGGAFLYAILLAVSVEENGATGVPVPDHEVKWDAENGMLDFSQKSNGLDVAMMVAAINMQTGEVAGTFGDAYKNVKFTKNATSGAMSFSGERVDIKVENFIGMPIRNYNIDINSPKFKRKTDNN